MKFLPQVYSIASFGDGGFRFGDHSHLGSLLILPSGMRAWNVGAKLSPQDFTEVLQEKSAIDFIVLGTGAVMMRPPRDVLSFFAAKNLNVDFMSTSSAVHTFNVMLAERRRVAAALVCVP
jgi:uncharacterized protein